MEGGGGERTEKATPKKRRDARERGQVRKSMEVVTAFTMLCMFGGLSVFGPGMWRGMGELMTGAFSGNLFPSGVMQDPGLVSGEVQNLMIQGVVEFMLILLPILAVAMLAGLVGNLLQVGFLFSTKALAPKMERINPLKGLKRMFSLRTLFELLKSMAKIVVIGIIATSKYSSYIPRFSLLSSTGVGEGVGVIGDMVLDTGFTIAFALLLIGVIDYVYQWFKYEKDLKMTKYEVKLEYKQQEGDPQVKGRIKQKQRQMAMMRMMQDVPDADVVITNPTHYAVALKYDENISGAPIVTAKGKDLIAQRIKDIAREHEVEIVENKEVAQSLFSLCDIGSEVPLELYQAIAQILAFVYRKKNKIN